QLMYLERYVNDRKYADYATFSEVKNIYHPIEGKNSFMLGYTDLKKEDNYKVLLANPDKNLSIKPNRFYIHPEMLPDFEKDSGLRRLTQIDGYMEVSPTSSTRTVWPVNNYGYYVKTHLDRRISRYIRRVRKSSVEHSIKISRDIEEATDAPKEFGFLPETVGLTYGSIGQIIRETEPRPCVYEKRMLIPYFSLHSKDMKNPDDEPLMVQMIKEKCAEPNNFFVEQLIKPVISTWAFFAQNRGILLESHGQNTLLELNYDLEPTRVVHRDFQSLMVDFDIRRIKGLHTNFEKHILGREDNISTKQNYSFVYDWFLGHYLFDKMIECMVKHFNSDEKKIKGSIKEVFNEQFKDQFEFFPEKVYGFTEEFGEDNKTYLKIRQDEPDYR
ncbi:MAG: hypothetical protein KKH40_05040, partial [Nanoarchaeota archaeon]|nr:hypothetical protein [Nanoarchaeota archaeon]